MIKNQTQSSRREFIKKSAYIAPAIASMTAMPALASYGSIDGGGGSGPGSYEGPGTSGPTRRRAKRKVAKKKARRKVSKRS